MHTIIEHDYVNENEKALSLEFLHGTSKKKYILGINKLTKSVQKFVKVDGIIDDFSRVQRSRKKEILSIEDVPKDAIILWTSSGSPLQVKNRLDALGFLNISYLAFSRYSGLELFPHPFVMDFAEDYKCHKHLYEESYQLLADEKSRETFVKLLNFKISFDYSFMQGFENRHEAQYFDKEIVPELKNLCFVDGGGYVGDTAKELIKNYPDYKKIYLIEPIAENLRIAKRDLAAYENIAFIESGLSNKKAELFFHEEKSFSALYGSGSQNVKVDTLDNILQERVDYIKLDIEGAELEALEGAKATIQKYKPILAVCVYHKAEHWYRVPQLVLEMESNYKIYLRHYMEGIFETVMYFIPPSMPKIEPDSRL